MKLHQRNIEAQLIEIVNSRNNENKCGDCGSPYPTWASVTLGIFLCGRCASAHRRVLPSRVSQVKSLTLDNWTGDQIDRLRRTGNKKARAKWNSKREPFPYDEDDTTAIEQYIREKYLEGRFADGPVSDGDSTRLRLRLASIRAVPRLTHRKLTTFESSQFARQASQIMGFGYHDRDAVKEALILSDGDVNFALDILNEDEKVNPNQEELAPSLPRRPASSGSSFLANNPMASLAQTSTPAISSQPTTDWWSGGAGSSAATPQTLGQPQVLGQPQIYQYTDPVTGRISYIDSNGQEYLDPSNPQHQQLLNPQQTSNQQIMSLYNTPDRFTSNVAAPVDSQSQTQQPQQTQQTQFQPQQTQQTQFQPQQPQQTQSQFQPQQTQQTQFQPQFQPQYQQAQFQPQPYQGAQPLAQQPTAMGFQQPYGQQQYFQ